LGRIAFESQDYYHAIRWFIEALEQYDLERNEPTIDVVRILDYLAVAADLV
jgi:hypothetical protein